MLYHPDTGSSVQTEEKLVLPAPAEEPGIVSDDHRAQIYPGKLIRQQTPPTPKKLLPKLAWYWRKDPAYKVFMIAVVMMIVAGAIFLSLASASLSGQTLSNTSYPQSPSAKAAPTGTVDLQPTFPKPTGGQGSSQSSQPTTQSTPSLGPAATGTGQSGGLTVQIVNYTSSVPNGSRASVTVSTNQPGIRVYLQIRYNQALGNRQIAQTTDGNGNATFSWFVYAFGNGRKNTQAVVTAQANDQNGQTVNSNQVTIQIVTGGLPPTG
ncbi:MAG TPA: hypothetical protein VNE38_00435 [Ktedonobacteraceae bacterium]|nr:hypothetical protein [Ktedonobacteraceae bacterium]